MQEPTLGTSSVYKFFASRNPTPVEPMIQDYLNGAFEYKFVIWQNIETKDIYVLYDWDLVSNKYVYSWGKLSYSDTIIP